MSEIVIKTCPFCGATPEVHHNAEDGFIIECNNDAGFSCRMWPKAVEQTFDKALEVWNNRTGKADE